LVLGGDEKIDLHIHTNMSDGSLSPQQLVEKATKEKLKVISITDHDTVEGYDGIDLEQNSIDIILGIEISTRYKNCSIHILGYNFDINNEKMINALEKIKLLRYKEIRQVIRLLSTSVSEEISVKDVINKTKKLSIDSVANYLTLMGFAKSSHEAKERYLMKGKCAYVQKKCMEPGEVIDLLHEAKGIAILAHPDRIHMNSVDKEECIRYLIDRGIDGIEIYNSYTKNIDYYLELCKENNLLISGGSDYHDSTSSLGFYSEKNKVPCNLNILEEINRV
jgi:hypothetical protein